MQYQIMVSNRYRDKSSVHESFNMMIPTPIEPFDDEIIPSFLIGLTFITASISMLLSLFQLISSVSMYYIVKMDKKFWSKMIGHLQDDCWRSWIHQQQHRSALNEQSKDSRRFATDWNDDGVENRIDSDRSLDDDDEICSEMISHRFRLSHHLLDLLARKQIQNRQGRAVAENTWKAIFFLTDTCLDRHECRFCSIECDLEAKFLYKNLLFNFFSTINQSLGKISMLEYRQSPTTRGLIFFFLF